MCHTAGRPLWYAVRVYFCLNGIMATLRDMLSDLTHSIDQMMEAVTNTLLDDVPVNRPSHRSTDGNTHFMDDGSAIVNGVAVPAMVVQQLRQLGMSLDSFNAGELEAAVRACATDCTLIDDRHGVNFIDQLEHDSRERAEEEFDDDADALTYRKFSSRVHNGKCSGQNKGAQVTADIPDTDIEQVSAIHETAASRQERANEARNARSEGNDNSFRSRIIRERERRKEMIVTAAETGQPLPQELSA
jgi:hypothetical protein